MHESLNTSEKEKPLSKKQQRAEIERKKLQKQLAMMRAMQFKPITLAVRSAIPTMCSKF